MRNSILFVLFTLVTFPTIAVQSLPKVLIVTPNEQGFWAETRKPLTIVGKNLRLKLIFVNPPAEFYNYLSDLKSAIEEYKPNYIIWSHRRGNPNDTLSLFEEYKIPAINIVTQISENYKSKVGIPQQKFKHWLAQIIGDDYNGSALLAEKIINKHQNDIQKINSRTRIIVLGGNRILETSKKQIKGVTDTITTSVKSQLLQVVYTNWKRKNSANIVLKLIDRYRTIDAYWAPNEQSALGVLDAYQKQAIKRLPIIGHMDWSLNAFNSLESETFSFSMGGNHLYGVWALVLIYDHIKGKGLKADYKNSTTIKIPLVIADKSNIARYRKLFDLEFWKNADLTIYSRYHNPDFNKYMFDLNKLIEM